MRWMLVFLLIPLAGCLGGEEAQQIDQTGRDFGELSFLDPVALVCPDDNPLYVVYDQQYQDCAGFGEPTLEVAGDGTIWYSSVCCVGQAPPIWRSYDGGLTFQAYPFANMTGVIRDSAGVEGDFAIDTAGNVYFFDITAATAYITKFSADGTHQHTKPDAFPPLVDRPWVRAGQEDEVFIFYNTGAAGTNFFSSNDGGLTWDYPGYTNFPCALMTFGQGYDRDNMVVSGCSEPGAWLTTDAGASWTDKIDLPLPVNWTVTENYMQPSIDTAGDAYIPVTVTDGAQSTNVVYRVAPDGEVFGPFWSSPTDGIVDKPWSIAGNGTYAQAYYLAENVTRETQEGAEWHLVVDYTHDGGETWTTQRADEKSVLTGVFGRSLGDFLELRQAENGDLVIAYAAREDGQLVNYFVRSTGMDFGHPVFTNG
jgi:hypothetical protein